MPTQFKNILIKEEDLKKDDWDVKTILQINNDLITKFTKILQQTNSKDLELYTAIAILHVLNKDYKKSLHYFSDILSQDKQNYLIWNKIAAM